MEPDEVGLPPVPPGMVWLRFMGGPYDGQRRLHPHEPPDRYHFVATQDVYERVPSVEQLDIEAIYYPMGPER